MSLTRGGWTPLHLLASNADKKNVRPGMVRQLVDANADLEARRGRGMTPLLVAASTGNVSVAEQLLICGADPYAMNDEGTSAVDMAKVSHGALRRLLENVGVSDGSGVTGAGRLFGNLDL